MSTLETKKALYKASVAACKGISKEMQPSDLAICYTFFESRMLQKRIAKIMHDRTKKGVKWSQLSSFWGRFVGAESRLKEWIQAVEQAKKDIVEIEFAIKKGGLSKRENNRLPGRLARKKDKLSKLQESLKRAEIENELMKSISAEVEAYKLNRKK